MAGKENSSLNDALYVWNSVQIAMLVRRLLESLLPRHCKGQILLRPLPQQSPTLHLFLPTSTNQNLLSRKIHYLLPIVQTFSLNPRLNIGTNYLAQLVPVLVLRRVSCVRTTDDIFANLPSLDHLDPVSPRLTPTNLA